MNVGKKAALLIAAAGALVLVGAGGASAQGIGDLFGGGVEQTNECSTAPGPLTSTGAFDAEYDTDCINIDVSGHGASEQTNRCSTAPGAVALTGLVGTSSLEYHTQCVNFAGEPHHSHSHEHSH